MLSIFRTFWPFLWHFLSWRNMNIRFCWMYLLGFPKFFSIFLNFEHFFKCLGVVGFPLPCSTGCAMRTNVFVAMPYTGQKDKSRIFPALWLGPTHPHISNLSKICTLFSNGLNYGRLKIGRSHLSYIFSFILQNGYLDFLSLIITNNKESESVFRHAILALSLNFAHHLLNISRIKIFSKP